jgi:hypothetical protein
MSETETYNGWPNRETWCLQLWLSNDEGLYNMTRERVADMLHDLVYPHWIDEDDAEQVKRYRGRKAGETVKELWEELTDPDEQLMSAENILTMVRDIGSDYRVDWDEIGESWLPENQ